MQNNYLTSMAAYHSTSLDAVHLKRREHQPLTRGAAVWRPVVNAVRQYCGGCEVGLAGGRLIRVTNMAEVLIKGLKKTYDGDVTAVHDVNLHIQDKEFIVLVGPSGCGKSTTLRMVAGLEEISGGELYIDGKLVNDVAPKDRDIAMVFQSYALYPHMTV